MTCSHPLAKLVIEKHDREESGDYSANKLLLRCHECAEFVSLSWLTWDEFVATRIQGSSLKMADEINSIRYSAT